MSLILRNVTFRYPRADFDVLSRINLVVGDGESVAIMGPSGRGKSTLLSLAGLLLEPQEGSVEIDGIQRTTADATNLLGGTLSWVLQTVSLLPRRSLLDNVSLPLLAKGMSRSDAYCLALDRLQDLGLDSLASQPAMKLSGGEAQRVGVARALVTNPSVLLADEPTANLDRRTANTVASALFAATGDTSVLISTHDEEIALMADRVFVLGMDDNI